MSDQFLDVLALTSFSSREKIIVEVQGPPMREVRLKNMWQFPPESKYIDSHSFNKILLKYGFVSIKKSGLAFQMALFFVCAFVET